MSTVDNTRGYARVSHSRQWSNYNKTYFKSWHKNKQVRILNCLKISTVQRAC